MAGKKLPAFIFVTDGARQPDPVPVLRTLPRGWGVLFRHYDHPLREALGRRVARLCKERGLRLLVAGDVRLAARLKADGLHLPEGLARRGILSPALLWRQQGRALSIAAHSPGAVRRAKALRADLVVLSPVFPTVSHPNARPLGPLGFLRLKALSPIPVAALGGMRPATARRLRDCGAFTLALVDGVFLFLKGAPRLSCGRNP